MRTPARATARRARGFTFVELIIFIVVLSVGLTGIVAVINQTVARSSDPLIRVRAVELGQAYLDEILPRKFDENSGNGGSPVCDAPGETACSASGDFGPGVDAGETSRDRYDDVDDYHGITDDPPVDATGAGRAGYDNYSVTVSVSYAGTDIGLTSREAKRIDVVVTDPQNDTHAFSAYRTNF